MDIEFRAQIHAHHPVWGAGTVLDSRIQDDCETMDVVFENVDSKRLSASLSNLIVVK